MSIEQTVHRTRFKVVVMPFVVTDRCLGFGVSFIERHR